MLGKTLAQYCPTDSAMAKEQKRIETELQKFETNIWGDQARKDSIDSIAKAQAANPKAVKKAQKENRRTTQAATGNTTTATKKAKTRTAPAASSASRVSVRRQRH